ncbi:MAG TPA: PUA domain-containing protein, partial [Candidatus Obscuribacterales bacterium]
SLAGGAGSHRGTGGMQTKIQAADIATRAGIGVRIVSGAEPDVLIRLAKGEAIGTWFRPRLQRLEARKRWILSETVMNSRLTVDAGAREALLKKGKSLLAAGVLAVEGEFDKGQTIRIFDSQGSELARGLSRYASDELNQIRGHKSDEINGILGFSYGPEAVHRNDLVRLAES